MINCEHLNECDNQFLNSLRRNSSKCFAYTLSIVEKRTIWCFNAHRMLFCFIFLGNCYSHILHNSVKHAHRALPIDVEQISLSIYSHFSHSAKRIK